MAQNSIPRGTWRELFVSPVSDGAEDVQGEGHRKDGAWEQLELPFPEKKEPQHKMWCDDWFAVSDICPVCDALLTNAACILFCPECSLTVDECE